jgi:hypothetical protein
MTRERIDHDFDAYAFVAAASSNVVNVNTPCTQWAGTLCPYGKDALAPPDLRTQAGRVRWAREAAGFSSARAAAENFEWNENTYKSHEQGIRGKDGIKPRHLEKYARAFNVSPEWLAFGRGGPGASKRTRWRSPASCCAPWKSAPDHPANLTRRTQP